MALDTNHTRVRVTTDRASGTWIGLATAVIAAAVLAAAALTSDDGRTVTEMHRAAAVRAADAEQIENDAQLEAQARTYGGAEPDAEAEAEAEADDQQDTGPVDEFLPGSRRVPVR